MAPITNLRNRQTGTIYVNTSPSAPDLVPNVSIIPSVPGVATDNVFTFTFRWNQPVNNFTLGDISLAWYDTTGNLQDINTAVGHFSDFTGADGSDTYGVTLNLPQGRGQVDIIVAINAATSVEDMDLTGPLLAVVHTLEYATVAPAAIPPEVEITFPDRITGATYKGLTTRVRFTFTEPIADFVLSDDVVLSLNTATITDLVKTDNLVWDALLTLPETAQTLRVTVNMDAVQGLNARGPSSDTDATLMFDNRLQNRDATNDPLLPNPVTVHTETNTFAEGIFNGVMEMKAHTNELFMIPQLMHARGSSPMDFPHDERMARAELSAYNIDSDEYNTEINFQYVTTGGRSLTTHGSDLYWFDGSHYAYNHNQGIELEVEDGESVETIRWKQDIGKLRRLRFGSEMREVTITTEHTISAAAKTLLDFRSINGAEYYEGNFYFLNQDSNLYRVNGTTLEFTDLGVLTGITGQVNLRFHSLAIINSVIYTGWSATDFNPNDGRHVFYREGLARYDLSDLSLISDGQYRRDDIDIFSDTLIDTNIVSLIIDGGTLLYTTSDGQVRRSNLTHTNITDVTTINQTLTGLSFVGSTLYASASQDLFTLDLDDGSLSEVGTATNFGVAGRPVFINSLVSDGTSLFSYPSNLEVRDLYVFDLSDGTLSPYVSVVTRTETQTFLLDGTPDEVGEWRSAFVNPDRDIAFRDEYYGKHGGMASNMVSGPSDNGEPSVLNLVSGYGNLDNIGDNQDAVALYDNWQWLQCGERLNPKLSLIETNARTGWNVLEDISILFNTSIGFDVSRFFLRESIPSVVSADYTLELNSDTLQQPLDSINFRNDLDYLYNTVKVRHGDQVYPESDAASITANTERVLELNTLLDSHQELWARWIAGEYLQRFATLHQIINLDLKLSDYIKVGDIVMLRVEDRAHLNELVQVLEVTHNLDTQTTSVILITIE